MTPDEDPLPRLAGTAHEPDVQALRLPLAPWAQEPRWQPVLRGVLGPERQADGRLRDGHAPAGQMSWFLPSSGN